MTTDCWLIWGVVLGVHSCMWKLAVRCTFKFSFTWCREHLPLDFTRVVARVTS